MIEKSGRLQAIRASLTRVWRNVLSVTARRMDQAIPVRRALLFPADIYAALVIAYLLLRAVNQVIYVWPVEIISVYLHLFLVPAIPLLILALLLRSRRTAVLLSVGAIAFLWLYGGQFVPRFSGPDDTPDVTVMSYNTGIGKAPWDKLSTAIRESGTDMVAIQESLEEQVPLYRRDLADEYPYQVFHDTGVPGIGLLSRHPILSEEKVYLASSRVYLVVDIAIDGRRFTVINVHPPVMYGPGAAEDERRADFALLADLAEAERPAIVIGDLNVSDQNLGYSSVMNHGLIDTFREVGFGFGLTYPTQLNGDRYPPFSRIDYILTTAEFEPLAAWLGEDAGSDHLPVLAQLIWSRGG